MGLSLVATACGGGNVGTNQPPSPTTYTLTVNSANPSSGVAISYGNSLNNVITSGTTSFSVTYPAGASLVLTAPATSGSNTFASWTGCTSASTVTCDVTLNGNTTVTANYTLPSKSVAAAIIVDQASTGPAVTDKILGMNLAAWYDVTSTTNAPMIKQAFQTAGIKAVRWPGGSWSDAYNWETNTECGNSANTDDDFTDFVNNLVIPAGLDLALTADYGTGENCTGPGNPAEAAAWVAEALKLNVTVSHMTVGNEEYGSWETDNHTLKNNGPTYAAAVAGTSGYYALIKAASPNTLVGVEVEPDYAPWDQDVMSGAPYDFVEYHYYPEAPGQESDTTLVQSDAQQLTTNLNTIKSELAKWGTPNTPIYVGEMGSVYTNPGKQSVSITQALFAGQVLGEMMNAGVSRATWWIGFGGCEDTAAGTGANFSSSLYGWQSFGGYMVFSDGLPDGYECEHETLAAGVLLPTARAFQLFSQVAVDRESVLTTSVSGDTKDVVAYAATHSGGTALVLFNRNETTSEPVTVTLSSQTNSSGVTVMTYDKAIYDLSGSPTGSVPDPAGTNTWVAPSNTNLGAQSLPLTLTLTPWSMNVVIIQ